MSLRDDLAGVLARDPRYSIHAYAFVFEALEYTKNRKKRTPGRSRIRGRSARPVRATSPAASSARGPATSP